MLLKSNKYLYLLAQRTGLSFVMALVFGITVHAQNNIFKKDVPGSGLSPVLFTTFKHPAKPNPLLNERLKRPTNQLMSWPNYPLTAAQIAARDAKYDKPVVTQVTEEVLASYLNSIINGKTKKPAVKPPKF